MALPGHSATIKVTGPATTMTAAAMTGSGAGPYQINTTARRVWSPADDLTFYDGGVAISAANVIAIDYLFGKVTFDITPGGAVTVTGKYLPILDITTARSGMIKIAREALDTTCFHATNKYMTHLAGLLSAEGELGHLDPMSEDYDTGPGTMTWYSIMSNGTPKVVEVAFDGGTKIYRFMSIVDTSGLSFTTHGLVEGKVTWKMCNVPSSGTPTALVSNVYYGEN